VDIDWSVALAEQKMRVHTLAKDLGVTSKAILDKCRAEGLPDIKNHMSTLSAGLTATIREWFSEGAHETTVESAERVNLEKEHRAAKKAARRAAKKKASADAEESDGGGVATATADEETEAPVAEMASESVASAPAAETSDDKVESREVEVAAEAPVETEAAELSEESTEQPEVVSAATETETEIKSDSESEVSAEAPETEEPVVEEEVKAESQQPGPQIDEESEEEEKAKKPSKPAGPQNVPAPAKLQGPRVVRYEAPESVSPPRPRRRPTREESTVDPSIPVGGDPQTSGKRKRGDRDRVAGAGGGSPRRKGGRSGGEGDKYQPWRNQDLIERQERLKGATGRRIHTRRAIESRDGKAGPVAAAPPKTDVTLQEPIVMKDFCFATGVPMGKIFPILKRDHNIIANINMTLDNDMAELLALEFGLNLTIEKAKTKLDQLKQEFETQARPRLKSRPPVVTVLGHVDHGKTSLLDYIRHARVAEKEAGGITQHIGSYHYKKGKVSVSFLDTPGHAAFTAMRARGAQMTDVVVLVVAADDGIMPQTVEAINHAKAAEVPIVVALTKIDLGDQNVTKIYGQLTEHGLTPSGDWGGETDVIHTSTVTGEGVEDLLEHLSALAELLDLKADSSVPARGTVIEAETKSGVGAVVRVLVQEGTLKVGDTVVCGNAFGNIRRLNDSSGKQIKKAGPSIPVEIWGLNDVPMAGDGMYQVDTSQRAKDIAEEMKQYRISEGRAGSQKATSLEDMFRQRGQSGIPELNVIIRADVDGSVEALKGALEQFPSDEVRLTIRHAAVGAITDSDVELAAASNAIIIGFQVSATTATKKMAESRGVDVRMYRVIYDVIDDIKAALEGLLAPNRTEEVRATLEVRDVFNLTKMGTVAGCFVTDGKIERKHFIRLIRDGIVVRQKSGIASLRRFKDDVKEVRQGMECGVKLENFDDIKTGDTLESFEVVETARKLSMD
jgi:translation initiation factor IF-2